MRQNVWKYAKCWYFRFVYDRRPSDVLESTYPMKAAMLNATERTKTYMNSIIYFNPLLMVCKYFVFLIAFSKWLRSLVVFFSSLSLFCVGFCLHLSVLWCVLVWRENKIHGIKFAFGLIACVFFFVQWIQFASDKITLSIFAVNAHTLLKCKLYSHWITSRNGSISL